MIDLIYNQQQFTSLLTSVSSKASQNYGYTDTEMINDMHNVIFQRLGQSNSNINFIPTELHPSPMYLDMKIVNALHILQQQMSLIERLFQIKKITDSGYIAIWLCVQGEWTLNHLDDQVPYTLQQNQTKLVTIQSDQIWPILLEKAIVKILGKRYEVLNEQVENNVDSILFMLTGFPIQKYRTEELTELSNYIHEMNTLDHIVFVQNKGICYVIDNIVESDLDHEKLILLNAPNAELVLHTHLKVKQLKQNQFCLTWNEFRTLFNEISILQTFQKYKYSWKQLKEVQSVHPQEYSENKYAFKFNLQSRQHCFLTLCQRDQNMFVPLLRAPVLYSLVRVFVCLKIDSGFEFMSGDFNFGQNICLEMELEPGEYYVYIQSYSKIYQYELIENTIKQQKIIAQLVSNECVQFNDQEYKIEDLEKQMIIAFALSQANADNTRDYNLQGQPLIQVTTQMDLGLLIFYYKNLGEKTLVENISFKQSQNLIDGTAKPALMFTAELPPNTDLLKIYYYNPLKVFEMNQKFSYQLEIESNLQNTIQVTSLARKPQLNLRESQVLPKRTNQTYNENDLVDFLQKNGKSQQRLYNDEPTNILMYVYQHADGVVILYQNCTQEYTLQENIKFQLVNLSLKSAKVVMVENQVTIKVVPMSYMFLYLEIISKNNAFMFNSDHNYKVYISA